MMNKLEELLEQLNSQPEVTEFNQVIDTIDRYYHYTPTSFTNGPEEMRVINPAGENEGSCKIFNFAQIHLLDEMQTLNCFGRYYREDVLNRPEGSDHANIRTFMKHGWKHVIIENGALKEIKK